MKLRDIVLSATIGLGIIGCQKEPSFEKVKADYFRGIIGNMFGFSGKLEDSLYVEFNEYERYTDQWMKVVFPDGSILMVEDYQGKGEVNTSDLYGENKINEDEIENLYQRLRKNITENNLIELRKDSSSFKGVVTHKTGFFKDGKYNFACTIQKNDSSRTYYVMNPNESHIDLSVPWRNTHDDPFGFRDAYCRRIDSEQLRKLLLSSNFDSTYSFDAINGSSRPSVNDFIDRNTEFYILESIRQ